jgi:hypothetical protein
MEFAKNGYGHKDLNPFGREAESGPCDNLTHFWGYITYLEQQNGTGN